MSARQSYIVRLLRRLETLLVDHHMHQESAILGTIIHRLSHAEKVEDGLETLYGVQGFDRFALRLMWSLERYGIDTNDPPPAVEAYELSELGMLIRASLNGTPHVPVFTDSPIPNNLWERLYDQLHRYGRCIEDLKRRSYDGEAFRSIDQSLLYRILDEAGTLGEAARSTGRADVEEFTVAVSRFLQHVLDDQLFHDARIVHLLDNANITLQTALDASGTEDYDALQQAIDLLKNPQTVLD